MDEAGYAAWRDRHAPRVERLRDRHAGAACALLGTGPSLRAADLDRLRGRFAIGVNNLFPKLRGTAWKPAFYVAVSPDKIATNAGDIAALDAVCFLSHRHWDRALLPPAAHRLPIFTTGGLGIPASPGAFEGDLTRPVPVGNTVSFVALQIAYFLGFKTVVLLGFDHRFRNVERPNVRVAGSSAADPDHYCPDYHRNAAYHAPDAGSYETAFATARARFEAAGRRIVNATPGSALAVFPRVEEREGLAMLE